MNRTDIEWKSPVLWVGIGVLIAFGFITVYLLRHVGDDDPAWTRLVLLYEGVQAIVFAAAGALFGSSIQASRANAAEGRAATAESAAASATDAAAGGKALRGLLEAEKERKLAERRRAGERGLTSNRVSGVPAGAEVVESSELDEEIDLLERLTAFAQRVIPD